LSYKAKINKRLVQCEEIANGVVRLKHLQGADMNLNDTGKLVFKWLEETDSVNEITQRLIDHYGLNVSKFDTVYNDTLNLLIKSWRIGAIKWTEDIPNKDERCMDTSRGKFERLTLEQDEKVFKLLDEFQLDAYLTPNTEKNYINIGISMISKVTNYDIFESKISGGKIITMSQFDHHTNQLNLKGVYSDKKISIEDFEDMLICILKLAVVNPKYIQKKQKQIPVFMNTLDGIQSEKLIDLGFESKGVLHKEIQMQDVNFMLKYLDIIAL
jgi:hypothetical protein